VPPVKAPRSRLREAATGVRRLASAWAAVNLLLILIMLVGELSGQGSRFGLSAWAWGWWSAGFVPAQADG